MGEDNANIASALDDEEADDTVYFSMDQVMNAGSGGTSTKNTHGLTNEDDEAIDYFLENNSQWVICEWFLSGNCKFGDDCKYMHPKSMEN